MHAPAARRASHQFQMGVDQCRARNSQGCLDAPASPARTKCQPLAHLFCYDGFAQLRNQIAFAFEPNDHRSPPNQRSGLILNEAFGCIEDSAAKDGHDRLLIIVFARGHKPWSTAVCADTSRKYLHLVATDIQP